MSSPLRWLLTVRKDGRELHGRDAEQALRATLRRIEPSKEAREHRPVARQDAGSGGAAAAA